jgi:hypothetical protein
MPTESRVNVILKTCYCKPPFITTIYGCAPVSSLDMAWGPSHPQRIMSKMQFVVLNLVGGVCALLIAGDLLLGLLNGRLSQSAEATRDQFSQAQRAQEAAQNLVMRVARAGQSDPVLRDLLAKHDFKITPNTKSQTKPTP